MLNRPPSKNNICRPRLHLATLAGALLLAGSGSRSAAAEATSEQLEFFETKIRPLFVEHCFKCHSQKAEKLKGNLRLDTPEGVLHGGSTGPAIVPGDPNASLLIKAVRYADP